MKDLLRILGVKEEKILKFSAARLLISIKHRTWLLRRWGETLLIFLCVLSIAKTSGRLLQHQTLLNNLMKNL